MKTGDEDAALGDPSLTGELELASAAARLCISLAGGSLASFQLAGHDLNVLSWDSAVHDGNDSASTAPRPRGHFLCLDRWGPPSEAEEANGMGYHGEASAVTWHVLSTTSGKEAELGAALRMAGLEVRRHVKLSDAAPIVVVAETVTNVNQLGRVYNMVQHPSIAAPFLDENTLVDANGRWGFAQGANRTFSPAPEIPMFEFPKAINRAGSQANARHMTGGEDDVISYEVDPSSHIGWVCACNPRQKTLLGYAWLTADYPWISLWCCSRGGHPCARGLEFGTTGLHQPFPILARHPRLLGLPTSSYIDAGESHTRSYVAFLQRVPDDFRGVGSVKVENGSLTLTERDGSRTFTITSELLTVFQP
mmetsp:Transcript_107336/g.346393  ORF Transcript_107336/g.346393 Transcript_107336/m.346393 type:complete len:364 (-) Transcript_107336:74-1165(-)